MAYSQESRICSATSPLGKDALLVQRFSGEEAVSKLYQFEIDCLSEQGALDFEKIIGKPMGVHVELEGGGRRHFHGLVGRFAQGGSDRRFAYYRVELVPWLWCLTRTADCRVFQSKNVPDIVKGVFSDLGFSDYRLELTRSYKPREYCVQYRETDFNFVSRLMEEEGIAYFFEHDANKHTLVLADSPTGHRVCAGQEDAEYVSMSGAERLAGEIEALSFERELHPGKFSINDYNFETPGTNLVATTTSSDHIAGSERFEIYDFPTDHRNLGDGNERVRLRMEAEEADAVRIHGEGRCPPFYAGSWFTLKGHYRDDYNTKYLLTSVRHTLSQGVGYEEGQSTYANDFTCIPYSVPLRPSLSTPKPVVQGLQTAVVVGPAGDEIYVDKYGRVKVQFFWDRRGNRNEKSSCWVRVSQAIAGKTWGAAMWPRIGQEVAIQFLEGDPDHPIVVGRIYNAEQMPPYELPANATQSGIKTRSSKGGTADNFNEIRFEDKKGEEYVFLHAEKDQHGRVKHDELEWVGNDRHLIVKKDQLESVDGSKSSSVGGDWNQDVGGELSVTVGQSDQRKVGTRFALESGEEIHLKAGMKVVLEAGAQLTLKAAGGFVDIGPAGVTIQGTLVNINSGGSAGSGSGASPKKPTKPKEAMEK